MIGCDWPSCCGAEGGFKEGAAVGTSLWSEVLAEFVEFAEFAAFKVFAEGVDFPELADFAADTRFERVGGLTMAAPPTSFEVALDREGEASPCEDQTSKVVASGPPTRASPTTSRPRAPTTGSAQKRRLGFFRGFVIVHACKLDARLLDDNSALVPSALVSSTLVPSTTTRCSFPR